MEIYSDRNWSRGGLSFFIFFPFSHLFFLLFFRSCPRVFFFFFFCLLATGPAFTSFTSSTFYIARNPRRFITAPREISPLAKWVSRYLLVFFFFFFARQAAQLRDTKRRTRPFCFPNRPFAFFSIRFRRASRRSLWRETCASSPIRFYRNGFEIFIDIKSIENITPLKINPFCPIFINLY